jgi:prepilin-type N-terminal cleavage/methylation domain-containing protein
MRARTAPPRGGRARRGMTLVEVVVAMMILTGVLLVLGAFSARFSQATSQAHLVITANEIAASRLDEIRTQPTYGALDALTSASSGDTVLADNTRFTRVTTVRRVGGTKATDSVDYKLVTVTVNHPSMKRAVSKTSAMAAF